jgi:hypothetical protein
MGSPSDEPNNQPHAKAGNQPLREKFIRPRQISHGAPQQTRSNPAGDGQTLPPAWPEPRRSNRSHDPRCRRSGATSAVGWCDSPEPFAAAHSTRRGHGSGDTANRCTCRSNRAGSRSQERPERSPCTDHGEGDEEPANDRHNVGTHGRPPEGTGNASEIPKATPDSRNSTGPRSTSPNRPTRYGIRMTNTGRGSRTRGAGPGDAWANGPAGRRSSNAITVPTTQRHRSWSTGSGPRPSRRTPLVAAETTRPRPAP